MIKNLVTRMAIATALALSLTSVAANAAEDGGKVLLKVTGKIAKTNDQAHKAYEFTFKDLKMLEEDTVQATNEWVPAKSKFTGPLMRAILSEVGAKAGATEVILIGVDGYRSRAPIADFKKYNVVLAHTLNGVRMKTETKGPLWVMYPVDDFAAELPHNATGAKLVWNLVGMEVR